MSVSYQSRIKRIREDRNYSQREIAEILGISRRTYSDYERGILRIPVDHLITLARHYDVSMDYITGVSNLRTEFPLR